MPIHGEWRHLSAHAHLASLTGVPDANIVIAEDVAVDLVDGQASVAEAMPCGVLPKIEEALVLEAVVIGLAIAPARSAS
jgi:hypothetical protein